MQVIDRRGTPLTITFGDLNVGDAFQDDDGDICIKTDIGTAIYWTGGRWAPPCCLQWGRANPSFGSNLHL